MSLFVVRIHTEAASSFSKARSLEKLVLVARIGRSSGVEHLDSLRLWAAQR